MKPVLTLTVNPAIDLSTCVDNVFPEHKLRCAAVRHDPGGGGINVARAIRKLGGEALALYCEGGPSGAVLGSLLDRENVQRRVVRIDGWTRENFTVLERATGQQYRFVMPGPVLLQTEWEAILKGIEDLVGKADFLVASGSLCPGVPDDFYGRVAGIVSRKGGHLILDSSGPALAGAVRAGVYLLKPSLRELRELSGSTLERERDQEKAVASLLDAGHCRAVVVSLGAAGVLFASEAGIGRFRAPAVPVRSKVGAGDSMVAGIVLALSRRASLRDAVRFGVAAGAAAVMNAGTELCHREDAEHLLESIA